jgi:hypothetical protein
MPRVEFGYFSRRVDEWGWRVSEMGTVESFVATETGLGAGDGGTVG